MVNPVAVAEDRDRARQLALLKAVGLDRAAPEQRELALAIAKRYDLDLLLKHLVLIEGKPVITRDGLLWIAHRSGQFNGIAVTRPVIVGDFWECEATVYRKDMTHDFSYPGRYPVKGKNVAYGPEMCIKVAESMALRRAFNVSAPTQDERWDVDLPQVASEPAPTLKERAASIAAAIQVEPDVTGVAQSVEVVAAPEASDPPAAGAAAQPVLTEKNCGEVPPPGPLGMEAPCFRPAEHRGPHNSSEGSWPA